MKTVAICGKIEVNDSCLETFEFFESVFKPYVCKKRIIVQCSKKFDVENQRL